MLDLAFLRSMGLLVLRVSASAMMLFGHGLQKLLTFSEKAADFADPIGVGPVPSMALAVFAEFFCSIAVAVGFKTRWAAVPLVVMMAVAGFVVHAADPFRRKELAFLYGACFLAILLVGPGKYSVDGIMDRE